MKLQIVVAALMLSACSSEKQPANTSTPKQNEAADIVPSATDPARVVTSTNPCERTGLWAECTLERRLKQSGFVVTHLAEKPSRAGFSVAPIVYSLGKSRIEAFFYKDEAALLKDLQAIDTLIVAPRGASASWPSAPMLLHSANLAVVVLGQDARQSERVMLAITAGPPQPGSPR